MIKTIKITNIAGASNTLREIDLIENTLIRPGDELLVCALAERMEVSFSSKNRLSFHP
jgi:hypothetical protein